MHYAAEDQFVCHEITEVLFLLVSLRAEKREREREREREERERERELQTSCLWTECLI